MPPSCSPSAASSWAPGPGTAPELEHSPSAAPQAGTALGVSAADHRAPRGPRGAGRGGDGLRPQFLPQASEAIGDFPSSQLCAPGQLHGPEGLKWEELWGWTVTPGLSPEMVPRAPPDAWLSQTRLAERLLSPLLASLPLSPGNGPLAPMSQPREAQGQRGEGQGPGGSGSGILHTQRARRRCGRSPETCGGRSGGAQPSAATFPRGRRSHPGELKALERDPVTGHQRLGFVRPRLSEQKPGSSQRLPRGEGSAAAFLRVTRGGAASKGPKPQCRAEPAPRLAHADVLGGHDTGLPRQRGTGPSTIPHPGPADPAGLTWGDSCPCRMSRPLQAPGAGGGWTRGHRLSQPVSSPRGQLAQGAPGGLSATCLRKGLPSGYVRGQGAGLVGLEPPVDKPRQEPTPRAGRDLQQALDQPPSAVTSPALPWGLPCRGQEGLGRTGLPSAEASGRKRRPGGSGVGPPGRPRGGAGWAP